jgi:hypothetical protein
MNNFNENQVNGLISNAILTTAMLSNEVCIQTKGESLFPEHDYVSLVGNFQLIMSKKIMPPKNQTELKEEAKKYITDILRKLNEGNDNDNRDSGTIDENRNIDESGNVNISKR